MKMLLIMLGIATILFGISAAIYPEIIYNILGYKFVFGSESARPGADGKIAIFDAAAISRGHLVMALCAYGAIAFGIIVSLIGIFVKPVCGSNQ